MKKFLACGIAVMLAEIAALIFFALYRPFETQDAVAVNEAVQTVTRDFYNLSGHINSTSLDYAVIDNEGNVIFKTADGLSESINAAISHRDTVLDIVVKNAAVGKIIIYNGEESFIKSRETVLIAVLSTAIAIECGICLGYAVYLHFSLVKPFKKMKSFAERVAGGNLDIPLEMDRRNIFGAFTESFDIMRSELKKARLAEAQAQSSKKELVAKLSHDIKTPVASIKALSEVGLAVAKSDKDRENYTHIIGKADQINTLVTNLFTATLEELQQLTVTPAYVSGKTVKKLLENSDYLHRAYLPAVPECTVVADKLRLQQVFDNIFANSYKYANTEIFTAVNTDGKFLCVSVEDCGGGVDENEVAVIKEKFKRGSNSAGVEGAGLGLYISDYFMNEMYGALAVENGENGLKVTVKILLK